MYVYYIYIHIIIDKDIVIDTYYIQKVGCIHHGNSMCKHKSIIFGLWNWNWKYKLNNCIISQFHSTLHSTFFENGNSEFHFQLPAVSTMTIKCHWHSWFCTSFSPIFVSDKTVEKCSRKIERPKHAPPSPVWVVGIAVLITNFSLVSWIIFNLRQMWNGSDRNG